MGVTLAWVAAILAGASLLVVLLAGPGYRAQLWGVKQGVLAMTGGAFGAAVAGVLGLVALLLLQQGGTPRWLSLGALLVGLVIAVPLFAQGARARQLPRIHDISTVPDEPLAFSAIVPLREGAPNSLAPNAKVAALQKQGYPEIAPLTLRLPPTAAYARAERVARATGWEIVATAPGEGRIEATDTSFLFGFKDDVVIRVASAPEGSRVDMRSVSRVGISDLGVNAKRIRTFLAKVAAEP